jgi:hypothetical protein
MSAGYYPVAGQRGTRTLAEALAAWPLAAQVLEYVQRVGPVPVPVIARELGLTEREAADACWWWTFDDDNGYERQLHGLLLLIEGERMWTQVRWVWSVALGTRPPALERRLAGLEAAFYAAEEASDER